MIIVEFKKDKNFLDVVRRKIDRFFRKLGSPITIYISTNKVLVESVELGLNVALLYSIYKAAEEKGLEPKMYYIIGVEPEELIPDDVKELGNAWRTRKLKTQEIQKYKDKILTGELMDRLERAKLIKLFSS